jgi:galactokinase
VSPPAGGSRFEQIFGILPEAAASAPGRVNLLGDHTDYNDGFVLPSTIPQKTSVEIAVGSGDDEAYSEDLRQHVRFLRRGEPLSGFARYLGGCLRVLEEEGIVLPPVRLAIRSDVPMRAGLSSSAALEVATLRVIDARFGLGLEPVRLAKLAQRAEVEHAGVACGIMDQMASSVGRQDTMLFLDTMTLEQQLLPLPEGAELLVLDSGVTRELAHSPYNQRREECKAAAEALGIPSLRFLKGMDSVEQLPTPLRERARHVYRENELVVAAVSAPAAAFGRLMNQSHNSLSTDFQVSPPAIDQLVLLLQEQPEVFGARMTGAGFGGACVALVQRGKARDVGQRIVARRLHLMARPSIVVPPLTSSPEQVRGRVSRH